MPAEPADGHKLDKINLKLLTLESFGPIIDAATVKIRETDEK